MKTKSILVLVIVAAISTGPTVSADILYNVTDLGSGEAFSVNNRGQIVGFNGYAVRFDPNGSGNNTVLGSGIAWSINDSNEIVGTSYSGGGG